MKRNIVNDADLVKEYKKGNEAAFEQLVLRHKSKVYSTIYLIVKDRYIAEDLFQETFIKAIDTIREGRYNEEGKFLPWILRIAHNLAIDYFRRDKRYPTVELEEGTGLFDDVLQEQSYETRKMQADTKKLLRELIQTLPEAQREVLMLRHFAGMSFQEIADHTGVSINTALGRMRYALINLRRKLEKLNYAYDKDLYPK